ncbi:sulfur carrier protein ThiS [Lysinibacillus sp. BW-2-10]|nr:sulfur carrier protein ThiS [Lysinibacillus sp. BW-2-10]
MGNTTERVLPLFALFLGSFAKKEEKKVRVNGVITTLTQHQSLIDYLRQQNYDLTKIAVERNGEIVPKDLYHSTILGEDDQLEIVHFVGGG